MLKFLEEYSVEFICLDNSELLLQGNYNSRNMKTFGVMFGIKDEHCRNGEYDTQCVTTREFDQRISNISILTLTNQRRFVSEKYDGTPIVEESIITWYEFPRLDNIIELELQ